MKIKRTGKCDVCKLPVVIYKEFAVTVNLFDQQAPNTINSSVADQILAWRDKPIYCAEHTNE